VLAALLASVTYAAWLQPPFDIDTQSSGSPICDVMSNIGRFNYVT